MNIQKTANFANAITENPTIEQLLVINECMYNNRTNQKVINLFNPFIEKFSSFINNENSPVIIEFNKRKKSVI